MSSLKSLVSHKRFLYEDAKPLVLQAREARAAEFLPERLIHIKGHPKEFSTSLVDGLKEQNFVEVMSNICQLADLQPFSSADEYLRVHASSKRRTLLRRRMKLFTEHGGQKQITPLRDLSDAQASELFEKIVVPSCTNRSMNPYRTLYADGFHTLIRSFDITAPSFYISLTVGDTLVAGALVSAPSIAKWTQEACQENSDGHILWQNEVAPNSRVLNIKFALVHPSIVDSKVTAILPTVLYWLIVRWAIEQKYEYISGGIYGGRFWTDDYFGVIQMKKYLGMSTAAFVREGQRDFLRAPTEYFLGKGRSVGIPFLRSKSEIGIRYISANGANNPILNYILASDPHIVKDIIVSSSSQSEEVQKLIEKKQIDAKLSVWS